MVIKFERGVTLNGILAMRKASGMTQAELAAKLGVSQTVVSDWESAKKYPTADKLPAIAAVLNCTIDALFEPPT